MGGVHAWFGHMRSGEAAIVFPEPTLQYGDKPIRTGVRWWRIRRIFGIGGKRFVLALIVLDKPVGKMLMPETLP